MLGMVVQACIASTWEVEGERSGVQVGLWLHSEFQVSPGYLRLCLKSLKGWLAFRLLHGQEEKRSWLKGFSITLPYCCQDLPTSEEQPQVP